MIDPSKPNGNSTSGNGHAAAPPASPFDKPVPEGAAQTVSAVLGEIVWLMSASPVHKQFFIADLEWMVMTPVILQQFRMYYQNAPQDQGGKRPIGVLRQRASKDMLWARVSAEVEAMLEQGTTRMRPQDWKSGERLWVVEVIAPFGGQDAMVADLKAKVFPEEKLKVLALVDGKKVLRVV